MMNLKYKQSCDAQPTVSKIVILTTIMDNFNITSCNIRGLGDYKKRRELFHYFNIRENGHNLLQETHSVKKIENYGKLNTGGSMIFGHGNTK